VHPEEDLEIKIILGIQLTIKKKIMLENLMLQENQLEENLFKLDQLLFYFQDLIEEEELLLLNP